MDLTHRFSVPAQHRRGVERLQQPGRVGSMLPRRHDHQHRGRRIHRFGEDQIGSDRPCLQRVWPVRGTQRRGPPGGDRGSRQGQAWQRDGNRDSHCLVRRKWRADRGRGADRPGDHRKAGAIRPRSDLRCQRQAAGPVRHLRFRAFRRRPRCDRGGVAECSRLQRMPTPDSTRRTPSRQSSSKPCPPQQASSEVGSSSGADVAPPAPEARSSGGSASLRTVPLRLAIRATAGQSELNVFSTVVPVVLKRYGPALAVVGLLRVRRDQDHSTQVVIHRWTARSTRSPSAS